jgi:hypothetical protein
MPVASQRVPNEGEATVSPRPRAFRNIGLTELSDMRAASSSARDAIMEAPVAPPVSTSTCMRSERPFACTVCKRNFPWLRNFSKFRCHTCETMVDYVSTCVAMAKLVSPSPRAQARASGDDVDVQSAESSDEQPATAADGDPGPSNAYGGQGPLPVSAAGERFVHETKCELCEKPSRCNAYGLCKNCFCEGSDTSDGDDDDDMPEFVRRALVSTLRRNRQWQDYDDYDSDGGCQFEKPWDVFGDGSD